jgi:dihydrolipoamide dehydrogenase
MKQKLIEVDIAIIGTGTAGMQAYKEAIKVTDSIALIEGDQYGTICARVGCMPSKLLIAAAQANEAIKKAAQFGIQAEAQLNGKKIMQRVRDERDRFVGFVLKTVEGFKKEHLYKSKAKFIDPYTLELEDSQIIKARTIILAVGSRPNIPEIFQNAGDRLITSDDVFYWQDLPKSVAVVGTGIIGLELGQAFAQLDIRTKIFGRTRKLASLQDPISIKSAAEIFTNKLDLELEAEIIEIKKNNQEVEIKYKNSNGAIKEDKFEYLLAATGRRSNLDNLDLDKTGIELDDKGIPVFNLETCQCGNSHIFIAGDANNKLPLLHEASDEGKISGINAARYLRNEKPVEHKRRAALTIVFSEPQIMQAGISYKELIDKKIDFEIGEVSFKNQGRSRVFLVNEGILRVYGEKETGKFLGAEMIGPSAEHIGHLLAWSYQSNLKVSELLDRPFYHPTIEEGLRTALVDLEKKLN